MKLEENSQFGFMLDQSKCVGCRTSHFLVRIIKICLRVNFRRVFETEGGNWTAKEDESFEQSVFAYYTSISCNHCSNPSCLKACPTGATTKK